MVDRSVAGRAAARAAAKSPSQVFGPYVRSTRKVKEWSQQDLAERLEELGHPLDRSAIARIETGGRAVSLDEALAICAALGVSPVHMIVPQAHEDFVAIAPKLRPPGLAARSWIRGERPLDITDDRAFWQQIAEAEAQIQRDGDLRAVNELLVDVRGYLIELSAGQLDEAGANELEQIIDLMKRHVDRALTRRGR